MTKNHHAVQCQLCRKFITFEDMLDDALCEACASKIETIVEERSRLLRYVLYVSALAWIAMLSLFLAFTRADAFMVEYYVTGVNLTTNERVVGWLDGTLGESEVSGYVLDRGDHVAVVGVMNGMGSYELQSLCCVYDVVVTDEVMDNKLENRKNAER